MRTVFLLSVLVGVSLALSCNATSTPLAPSLRPAEPRVAVVTPAAITGPRIQSAGAARIAPSESVDLYSLPNGDLLATAPTWLAARSAKGETFEHALVDGDSVTSVAGREGIIVQHKDGASCTFLRTPDLHELAHGPCTLPQMERTAVVFRGSPALLMYQVGETTFRVPVQDASIENVLISHDGRYVAVEDPQGSRLYDASMGQVRATFGGPIAYYGGMAMAAITDAIAFSVVGDQIGRVELKTGSELAPIRIGCRKTVSAAASSSMPPEPGEFDVSRDAHSLFVNAAGDRIVVGCESDILLFQNGAKTGRIPRVAPGCDNIGIPGVLDPSGKTLTLMGCGGIARIDLQKRSYRCADNEGIAGAAYAMVPGTDTRAPFKRGSLPHCNSAPEGARLLDDTRSDLWVLEEEEEPSIIVGNARGKVTLDRSEGHPTLVSPQVIATFHDGTVKARNVPSGTEAFTWKLW